MWCARFSDSQRQTLRDLIRAQGEVGPDLVAALEALDLARWDDLPEAELPWDSVAEQAAVQGITEADVIWDMSGRKDEPPASRPKRSGSKQGKRPSRRTRKPAP
jgi:hypothetical protein